MSAGGHRGEVHPNTNGIWNLRITVWRPAEQWGKLLVSSLLCKAEEMQTSQQPARLPTILLWPCPSTYQWLCVRFQRTLLIWWPHADNRSCCILTVYSLFSSLFLHHLHSALCQIPSGWCSWLPAREKARTNASCHTHAYGHSDSKARTCILLVLFWIWDLYIWGQNLPQVNLQEKCA